MNHLSLPGARLSGCALLLVFLLGRPAPAPAVTPPGLVFEAEDIATPSSAWRKDGYSASLWTLWTREQDIEKKRSRGAVLASPPVKQDRASPEEGAPPLHGLVTLAPGFYEAHLSAPGRPLAFSADGKSWRRYQGGELHLGVQDCRSGRFEFWIDDRFAHPPENPGPGYFDYVRFSPVSAAAFAVRAHQPWVGLEESVTREGKGWTVPAQSCEHQGFEPDGPRALKSPGQGAWLAWKADRAGSFYLGIDMIDDADGIEDLRVLCAGKLVAQCLGDRNSDSRVLYATKEPLALRPGDRLELQAQGSVGFYRIERLLFSTQPIDPPPLRLEHFTAWSPRPGTAHLCWTTSRPAPDGRLLYGAGQALDQIQTGNPAPGRNHRIILSGLDPTRAYQARVETADADGLPCASPAIAFRAAPPEPPASRLAPLPLAVAEPTGQPRSAWPVRGGVPFARGTLARVEDLRLLTSEGQILPLQAEPFARWPDGSVKIALLSFAASTRPGAASSYRLEAAAAVCPPPSNPSPPAVVFREGPDGWTVEGRGLHFDIPRSSPAFLSRPGFDRDGDGAVSAEERLEAPPGSGNLRLRTGDGLELSCGAPAEAVCETNGPLRAVVRWSGRFAGPAGQPSGWAYRIRAELFAGRPEMALDVAVWPDAPEPLWPELTSLSLDVPLGTNGPVRGAFEGRPLAEAPSGGECSVVQETERLSRFRSADREETSGPSLGVAVAANDRVRVTTVLPEFWQTYPNGLSLSPAGLRVDLLPALPPDIYRQEKPLEQLRLFGWCREGRYVFKRGQPLRKRVFLRYGAPDDAAEPAAFAAWINAPLLLQPSATHLCASGLFARPLFPRTRGLWEAYERFFDAGYAALEEDRAKWRTWGYMHHGDWFGERLLNYGNNEYDLAWALALQWGRTEDRRLFERGLQMARHHSSTDTLCGEFSAAANGLVYEHSFNHVGIALSPDHPLRRDPLMRRYLDEYGAMLGGAIDRQGHVFQGGNWIYAALTGDPWLRETAERVSTNQAEKLTPAFDFTIERAGGWPLINMVMAYHFGGDPYYLNAARLMVERALQRQDPESGGWLHWHAGGESGGETGWGGKAFAVGILGHGLLRYLDLEPGSRPEVENMLVRGADFLRDYSWVPGQGFRYISHLAHHRDRARRGATELLNAELAAFAYEKTGNPKHLDFLRELLEHSLEGSPGGNGKSFSMALRQTVYGLDRARAFGLTEQP